MKARPLVCLTLIVALIGLALSACRSGTTAPSPTETPAPPPTRPPTQTPTRPPPPPKGRCGDGVCDEAEIKDPSLCPQDCQPTPTLNIVIATATATPAPPTSLRRSVALACTAPC